MSLRNLVDTVSGSFSPRRARAIGKREDEQQRAASSLHSPRSAASGGFSARSRAGLGLTSDSLNDRLAALSKLAATLDEVEGDDAAALGEHMRSTSALAALLDMVSDPTPATHQVALYALGNLSSDVVDPGSWKTKTAIRQLNGFQRILPHAFSDDIETLFNALGAMQNLCSFPEYADLMRESGVDTRLYQIAAQNVDEQLTGYATGCLRNMHSVTVSVQQTQECAWPDLDEGGLQADGRSLPGPATMQRIPEPDPLQSNELASVLPMPLAGPRARPVTNVPDLDCDSSASNWPSQKSDWKSSRDPSTDLVA
mmetsp:Transcript_27449/g.59088  ORF Transcript_27449/g.59088 Transcript_27449/m.59088 type:complete len:312 (-) Transcript_27449:189-1124(-)